MRNQCQQLSTCDQYIYIFAVDSDIVSELKENLTAQIYLHHKPVTALLDSGAHMSLIDYDLLENILPNAHKILSKCLSKFSSIISVTGDSNDIEDSFT